MTRPAGYSGTPLPRKLGIGDRTRTLLDGCPDGFVLEPLPADAVVHHRRSGEPYDVIVAFCPDRATLTRRWHALHPHTTTAGALWIGWPKRSSGVATDLDENVVREFGLANGRVDVKVCAIDAIWSGLKFVVRVADR